MKRRKKGEIKRQSMFPIEFEKEEICVPAEHGLSLKIAKN
jgi:hypothetical protein